MSSIPVDNSAHAFLDQHDSQRCHLHSDACNQCILVCPSSTAAGHWKTSVNVGALVTMVAVVHYMYMREYWVAVRASPVVDRYIDWTITVPFQMIEFNLISKAAGSKTGAGGFWRLLIGTVVMLVFGYFGETHKDQSAMCMMGFAVGMAGWDSPSSRSLQVSLPRRRPRTRTSLPPST